MQVLCFGLHPKVQVKLPWLTGNEEFKNGKEGGSFNQSWKISENVKDEGGSRLDE